MPSGPKGEKRPADVIGAAIMVGKIATGEIEEKPQQNSATAELGRRGGKAHVASQLDAPTKRCALRPLWQPVSLAAFGIMADVVKLVDEYEARQIAAYQADFGGGISTERSSRLLRSACSANRK